MSIVKDSRGFMWFGTKDGLNRYAGGVVKAYRHDPSDPHSLPIAAVNAMLEDSHGRLWLGSNWVEGGLARYDFEQDRFVSFQAKGDASRPDVGLVSGFAEDHQQRIWIATQNGLFCYDPEEDGFTVYRREDGSEASLSASYIRSLVFDGQDRLWIGTNAGLDSLDLGSGRFRRWPLGRAEPSSGPPLDVYALHEDLDGTLWVGTAGNGLYHLVPATGAYTRYISAGSEHADTIGSGRVECLTGDESGRLFIGLNGGLDILDTRSGRFEHHRPRPDDQTSLSATAVESLLFDDQGILWIGTYYGGVNVLSPLAYRFRRIRASRGGLSSGPVVSILEDHQGDLWIGTGGGGLHRLDRDSGRVTVYRHDPRDPTSLPSDVPGALFEDDQGRLWVGSWGWGAGLSRFERESGRFVTFRHSTNGVLAEEDISGIYGFLNGELLVATDSDAELFDLGKGTFRPLSSLYPAIEGFGRIRAVLDDGRDGLWLGGQSRLGVLDKGAGRLRVYEHDPEDPESLASGQVWVLHADTRGNVWVGSDTGLTVVEAGLPAARPSPPTRPRRLRRLRLDGLPSLEIDGILEDDAGDLWVSSTRGLFEVVDAASLPAEPKILFFDQRDGLQGPEFTRRSAHKSRRGELFFGGPGGVSHFLPGEIRTNTAPPPVLITELRILNRAAEVGAPGSPLSRHVAETKEITLSHWQNVLTLEFAALDFTVSGKNRYAYRLENLEPEWNMVGTQYSATYAGLPPGDYVFRVRASNGDGVWNTTGASLRIHVVPPFWMTLWFRGLVVLLLGAAALTAYRRRERGLVLRRRELEAQVAARTTELRDEVAERRRAEEEVRRLNDALEARVARRTEQLQEETERLTVTLRSIGDGVIATDTAGHVVLLNRAAEQMTGWPAMNAIERAVADILTIVDQDTRVPMTDWAYEVLRGRTTTAPLQSALLLAQDGRELIVSASAAPIRDTQSRVVGIVVVFRDISERQRIEEQLRNAAKLDSLGVLAGGIAHDFNNLLSGIFGHIELAQRVRGRKADVTRHLQTALDVMARARGLTQQLLTFTTAGKPVTTSVALGTLLEDTARFALAGSNVDFVLDLPPDLWPCQVDGRQIAQVIENLLINARQAMTEGGTVEIGAENLVVEAGDVFGLDPGRYARVTVSDPGHGVPREIHAKVFDPFFTTKASGSGLGLAVCYSIVKRHGGHIALESTPGVGTAITVLLPAATGQAKPAPPPAAARNVRGRGRVLVMDDEAPLREVAREALESAGYKVTVARDGAEALAAIEHGRGDEDGFDVAILDLTVPGHSGGAEVLRRLRAVVPDLRAIASSGYSSDPIMAQPLAYGFTAALGKPYRLAELLDAVAAASAATPPSDDD